MVYYIRMKFYITGGGGYLGGACAAYVTSRGHAVDTKRVDVTDRAALDAHLRAYKPDVVINCAGVRAYPNIDWCEDHKPETVAVNVGGALNVMLAALDAGAYPVQMASGCMYEGGPEHAFTEEDAPNFFGSFYSRMRVVMQQALAELPVLQLRIRMPLSLTPHPRNLIDKILGYSKVISVPNSVTVIEDLWPVVERLAELRPTGILNATNDGYLTNEDILTAYRELVDSSHRFEIIPVETLERTITKARRSNCVLANEKLRSLGLSMPAVAGPRLREVIGVYGKQKKSTA